jgi:hypothetical protein
MTAHDLAVWDISVINQSILRPASYRTQQTETLLTDGTATTTFTADGGGGTAVVSASVAAETVATEIEVAQIPFMEIPTAGTWGLLLLGLGLGVGGAWVVGRM